MASPNHYHSMTDEQLAEWHQLTTRCDQLRADLAESRKATEAVQASAEAERSKLVAELHLSDVTVLNLTAKLAGQQGATRRLCGEQVQLVRALRTMVDSLKGIRIDFPTDERATAHGKAWGEAEEVLALVEVPFG